MAAFLNLLSTLCCFISDISTGKYKKNTSLVWDMNSIFSLSPTVTIHEVFYVLWLHLFSVFSCGCFSEVSIRFTYLLLYKQPLLPLLCLCLLLLFLYFLFPFFYCRIFTRKSRNLSDATPSLPTPPPFLQ